MKNRFIIDRKSLDELEIFHENGSGQSIFDVLNYTLTTGGKDKLQNIFLKPEFDLESILKNQEAVNYILKNRKTWNFPFNEKLMDQLEFYYFLNIDPVISKNLIVNLFEALRYRIFFGSYFKAFKEGIKNLFLFIQLLNSFYFSHKEETLPSQLKQIFSQLGEMLEFEFIKDILKKGEKGKADFLEVFIMDKAFRETYKEQMALLLDIIYELDVIFSKVEASSKHNLVFPEFTEDKTTVEISGLKHLLVKDCTTNDFSLEDYKNFMFLTGPNMAGKTTYLKAVGVAVYLAHIGFGVPAGKMSLTPFNSLFSSINTNDNIRLGYSYFYSEVLRVKEAAQMLQEQESCFMIFDELFRGTNVKDAYDGSFLVIKGLLNWQNSVFILSSHLIELAAEIKDQQQVQFNSFSAGIENGNPVFNYQLQSGTSEERLGLVIIKKEKVDELLEKKK